MSISLNDSIINKSPKDLNDKSGVFEAGIWRPYNSIEEALNSSKLILPYRNVGLTIYILKNGILTEYWWRDNILNEGLIIKETSQREIRITYDDLESDKITYLNQSIISSIFTLNFKGIGLLDINVHYIILSGSTKGFQLIGGLVFGVDDLIVLTGF